MRIRSFEWNAENRNHIAEHNIVSYEVEEAILFGKPFYQRSREGKYVAYAVSDGGRYLLIVFVIKKPCRIRVVTSRAMTEKEKRYYRKRKGGK